MNLTYIVDPIFCIGFPKWFDLERKMSVSELAFVTAGLIAAYTFLIYNIKTHFKDRVILEVKSLTFLFASFMMAYCLRIFYQIGLGRYKDLKIFSD